MTNRGPFYVGYLPLPKALRGAVLGGVLGVLVLSGLAIAALVRAQPPSGTGDWSFDEIVLEGVLTLEPYALLRAPDPQDPSRERAWLLVSIGKHGADARARAALGDASARRVRVHGLPLRRDGQRVLELVDGDGAIEVLGTAAAPPAEILGPVDLVGEIVDPKCWMGAMRPGSGLVHRACAALCIHGGIPPCFVGAPEGEPTRFWVLADARGGPCHDAVAEQAGVLVRLRGTAVRRGGVEIVHAEIDSIGLASSEGEAP